MTHLRNAFAALLAGAAASTAGAITGATALPQQPTARVGSYRITSRGERWIHARCVEGGHVVVAAHPARPRHGAAPVSRDAALRQACKSLDYSK